VAVSWDIDSGGERVYAVVAVATTICQVEFWMSKFLAQGESVMIRLPQIPKSINSLIFVSLIVLVLTTACGRSEPQPQPALTPKETRCLLTLVSGPKSPTVISPVRDLIAIKDNGDKANVIQPSPADLANIDRMIGQHKYSEVHQELGKLQEKHPSSFEIFYRDIMAFVQELNWARSLPVGDQRCESQTRFEWHDHIGLICQGTEAYLALFGPSNKYYSEMSELNEIAEASLKNLPCTQTIMEEWDQDRFISRLPGTAEFALKVEQLSYKGLAQ
jgi:hypothetical protein